MTKRLVIDDVRTPSFDAVVSRSSIEALELIRTEHWDEVWLDHDMDQAPVRTPDVTWLTARLEKDLVEFGRTYDVDMFVLHSANSGGRFRMRRHLDSHYLVIELEDYPDKSLAVTGGGVIAMYADGRHNDRVQKYPVALSARSAI
jgi:hypothetical protein